VVLASIRLYPVKSLTGVDVHEAEVEPWGLRHDRRWLLLEPDGAVLTAREDHGLLGITATPMSDGAIVLADRAAAELRVDPPLDGEPLPTLLSRLASVRSAGREADEWLSHRLGRTVRLGWLDDPRRRTVSAAHGGDPGDHLNLADAGPLLLTTEPSLRQLNAWAAQVAGDRGEPPAPLVMTRFRPSVVVDGDSEPFAEDGWGQVQIGSIRFRFAEQCDRCVLTTIDPHTLVGGKEPLRTLSLHRRRDDKTWFGIRLVPLTTGTIRVGDRVATYSGSTDAAPS
jgi:hypothetical protein